jgi:hypothetical protein
MMGVGLVLILLLLPCAEYFHKRHALTPRRLIAVRLRQPGSGA